MGCVARIAAAPQIEQPDPISMAVTRSIPKKRTPMIHVKQKVLVTIKRSMSIPAIPTLAISVNVNRKPNNIMPSRRIFCLAKLNPEKNMGLGARPGMLPNRKPSKIAIVKILRPNWPSQRNCELISIAKQPSNKAIPNPGVRPLHSSDIGI